jgi:hypothetical protein
MVFTSLFKFKKLLFFAVFSLLFSFSFAKTAYPPPFVKLENLKGQEKLDSAYLIFYRDYNKWDTLQAKQILQKMVEIAAENGNEAEEIFFLHQTAFYYAYALKMGSQHKKALKIAEKALQKAEKAQLEYWVAYSYQQLGNLSDKIGDIGKVVSYYWEAQTIFRQIGYKNSPWMKEFLFDWAKFNFTQSYQPDTALAYLRLSYQYKCLNSRKNIETPSIIAMILHENGKTEAAKDSEYVYFMEALNLAKQYKDSAWIGIIYGNLGGYYTRIGNYEAALEYYAKDSTLARQQHETKDLLWVRISMADIFLTLEKMDIVEKLITQNETENNLLKEPFYIPHLYSYKSKVLFAQGKYKEAYLAYVMERKLERKHGAATKIVASTDAKISLYRKIYEEEKKLMEKNRQNAIITRNSIIALLFSFLIIAFFLYNRRQLKNKAEKVVLEQKNLLALLEQKRAADELKAEKELLEQKALLALSEQKRTQTELENAQIQLEAYLENLLQKNEIIEKASVELEKYRQLNAEKITNISLDELYHSRLSTEEDWVKFKELFDKVYPHFLDSLRSKIKDITPSDLRVIALTKLNIRGKEMATMLGISYDSVRKAKYRLKKKMEQFEYSDLKDIFENVDN